MGINNLVNKIDLIKESSLENTNGNLGSFSVSLLDSSANDIAKSAALQYHEIDIDEGKSFYKKYVFLKKRVGKSKFAKKSSELDEEEDDPDVDEPTGEGTAYNDSKYQRLIKAHLVKLAQNHSLRANIFDIIR